jgi:phospholipid/cholesterol/gamma-HCH transport system substrate-binding protein
VTARARLLVALAAGAVLFTGCGFKGAYSLPLPGGAAHGKTYHVTAVFSDVQDLTVQDSVRVNDVAVGDVTSITLGSADLKAHVGMDINESVHLPRNAVATLDQTTLLGEKFVALAPPVSGRAQGVLTNGDVIDLPGSTSELPNAEQVFGLLSAVLNGGDLADLQTINVEVSKALTGRETAVRGALSQLNIFVGGLNHQKGQILRALHQLDRLSSALARQDHTIGTALTTLGPGLKVLAGERAQFTSLLTDLSRFGTVATHVINASQHQTVTALRDLQPILRHLAAAGGSLPRSLEVLVTFPFPRDSSAGSPGDYTNFGAAVNLAPVVCAALGNFTGSALSSVLALDGPAITELLGGSKCPAAHAAVVGHATSPAHRSSSPGPAGLRTASRAGGSG